MHCYATCINWKSCNFSALITGVLGGLLLENILAYIDAILLFSQYYFEYLQDMEKVFNWLRDANLKLHPLKCRRALEELNYPGFH